MTLQTLRVNLFVAMKYIELNVILQPQSQNTTNHRGQQHFLSSGPGVWATCGDSQSLSDSAHAAASSRYLSVNDTGRVLLIWGQVTTVTKVGLKDCSVKFLFITWLLNNNPEKHWCIEAIYERASGLLPTRVGGTHVLQLLEDFTLEKSVNQGDRLSALTLETSSALSA